MKVSCVQKNKILRTINKTEKFRAIEKQISKLQKEVLDLYNTGRINRYFLSASTSFGKTFLVYEIIRKMKYKNVLLVFPTIALLSENLTKIYSDPRYLWIKEQYKIHTVSNQGVIRIMFQALAPHYNKFKNNKIYNPYI